MSFQNLAGIASIVGLIIALVTLPPVLKRYYKRLSGKIPKLPPTELSYLQSFIKDLELRNRQNNWADNLYIPLTSELREASPIVRIHERIDQTYYMVKTLHKSTPRQIFNTLSNVEKIDSSHGTTFQTLVNALDSADDNAVIVLAPPGGGKSVSLRNLAIADAQDCLQRRKNQIPIFINLGHYISYDANGDIQPFSDFLENYFAHSAYDSFLANKRWLNLLQQSRCVFYLDALDELPRHPHEYEKRAAAIESFVRQWPNTRFILACRELDYDHQLTFQQILIKPFNLRQINTYLRRCFDKQQSKVVFANLLSNTALLEMCYNPFYLNFVCLYCKYLGILPASRVQLYNFLIERIVERENAKLHASEKHLSVEEFISSFSDFAFFMSVEKQSTTINLECYMERIASKIDISRRMEVIRHGIASGLLTYNLKSKEIRFSHHRFQEFFSSFVFVNHYSEEGFTFPRNFFVNIWWTETILFIAGLDENVSRFVQILLNARTTVSGSNDVITQLLKLDLLILAFRCIFANLQFSDESLKKQVRSLLFEEFNRGTSLERAKIASTLQLDNSTVTHDFLRLALKDRSNWVSETAFFALSGGEFQFKMTGGTILWEFFRFFFEGRIISIVLPIFRTARQSPKIRMLLPVFVALVVVNILCVAAIIFVLGVFLRFLLYKINYSFTTECIQCLFSLSIGAFLIIWFLFRSKGRFLQRVIFVTPLSLLVYIFLFAGPLSNEHALVRVASWATGLLVAATYRRLFARRRENIFSIWTITTFLIGLLLMLYGARLIMPPKGIEYRVFLGPIGKKLQEVINTHVENDLRKRFAIDVNTLVPDRELGEKQKIDNALKAIDSELSKRIVEPDISEMLTQTGVSPQSFGNSLYQQIRKEVNIDYRKGKLTRTEDINDAAKRAVSVRVAPVAERIGKFRLGRWLFFGVIMIMSLIFTVLVIREVMVLYALRRNRKKIWKCLRRTDLSEIDRIGESIAIIRAQPATWAQQLTVDYLVTQLIELQGRANSEIIAFLGSLAVRLEDPDLQDTVLRELEHEERNYRRLMQIPNSN